MPKRKAAVLLPYSRQFKKTRYQQHGLGHISIPVFIAEPLQRGYGLGGLFRGLFRKAIPLLKKGLTRVGQRALTAGANALADVSENNTPIREALKKQVKAQMSSLNPINRTTAKRKPVSSTRKTKQARARSRRQKSGFQKITL